MIVLTYVKHFPTKHVNLFAHNYKMAQLETELLVDPLKGSRFVLP
jgi:hypothetical protein